MDRWLVGWKGGEIRLIVFLKINMQLQLVAKCAIKGISCHFNVINILEEI